MKNLAVCQLFASWASLYSLSNLYCVEWGINSTHLLSSQFHEDPVMNFLILYIQLLSEMMSDFIHPKLVSRFCAYVYNTQFCICVFYCFLVFLFLISHVFSLIALSRFKLTPILFWRILCVLAIVTVTLATLINSAVVELRKYLRLIVDIPGFICLFHQSDECYAGWIQSGNTGIRPRFRESVPRTTWRRWVGTRLSQWYNVHYRCCSIAWQVSKRLHITLVCSPFWEYLQELIYTGHVSVLESPWILFSDFPGLESPWKWTWSLKVLESVDEGPWKSLVCSPFWEYLVELIYTGHVPVLESPWILFSDFPGLESPWTGSALICVISDRQSNEPFLYCDLSSFLRSIMEHFVKSALLKCQISTEPV